MVRPRLVEEGVPIGSTATTSVGNNNGVDEDDSTTAAAASNYYHRAPQRSSLQQAASRGSPGRAGHRRERRHHPAAHRTKVVIGGGDEESSSSADDRAATIGAAEWHGQFSAAADQGDAMEIYDDHQQHTNNSMSQPMQQQCHHAPVAQHQYQHHHRQHFLYQQQLLQQQQHQPPEYLNSMPPPPPPQQQTQYTVQSSTLQQLPQSFNHDPQSAQHPPADHNTTSTGDSNYTTGQPVATVPLKTRTHIEIGADYRETEKMEGVEDHSIKPPLIVVDGANVAFAYGQAVLAGVQSIGQQQKPVPDVRGLRVVDQFFGQHCDVRFVLTRSWLNNRNNSHPDDDSEQQAAILRDLQAAGKLVTAPVADDDDAYVLQICRRENGLRRQRGSPQQQQHQQHGWAYVLSNDHFRDAQRRQPGLARWLREGQSSATGPGRISFAFGDLGRIDDHGDPLWDILPNPRHPLVVWIEQQHLSQAM